MHSDVQHPHCEQKTLVLEVQATLEAKTTTDLSTRDLHGHGAREMVSFLKEGVLLR